MARKKIPGIYMIKNLITGKIYIGESRDIRTRWSKYKWAVNSTSNYKETKRQLILDMRKYGIDNFEFSILDVSKDMHNDILRLSKEAELIVQFKADDPNIGYNISPGFEPMLYNITPRKQSMPERLNRSKSIFSYDTQTGHCMLYLSGAKGWGMQYGINKDIASHTVKRGSLALNRYYLIYADPELRNKQLEIIKNKKLNSGSTGRALIRATNAFNKYAEAVKIVEQAAYEFGFK